MQVHVRGKLAYNRKASPSQRTAAGLIDLALAIGAFFAAHRALKLSPVPELWWAFAILALSVLLWAGQKALFGRTLGDTCWKLKAEHAGLDAKLQSPESVAASDVLSGIFLTLAAFGACAWAVGDAVFRQPLWAEAERLELDPYLPDMSSGQWGVLPFYYSLGAWPETYAGKPVFYSLPYEKGPPTRFTGHIIARWDEPQTSVTFEGPKTPAERTPREKIRQCLVGAYKTWGCLSIREATLLRHLNEMQRDLSGSSGGSTALRMKWKLRWFTVHNSAIPAAEQAQGIYLSAEDLGRGEERYILVTEGGTHQAIYLEYPLAPAQASALARHTFYNAIRSLRASDLLEPGRAWVDRQLQSTQLRGASPDAAPTALSSQAIAQIAHAQALLVSKISVEPSSFDAFFHLGGTSLLLQRHARKTGAQASELAASARPLIQSAYRYAQDIAPKDSRTTQLQGFWLESQKP